MHLEQARRVGRSVGSVGRSASAGVRVGGHGGLGGLAGRLESLKSELEMVNSGDIAIRGPGCKPGKDQEQRGPGRGAGGLQAPAPASRDEAIKPSPTGPCSATLEGGARCFRP